MQVSSDKILNKMANEIAKAKGSEGQKVKEHLSVVRALCDLLLDEQTETSVYVEPKLQSQVISSHPMTAPVTQQVTTVSAGEPVYMKEEDANGSSLFDF
ncbi:YwdI family protein [Bacillus cytotoxicus]|uniref:YwdI family protein n=1 Tax=Bacillus cereus group TaxID=86661 RepID=UPI001AED9823|nr:MULTISPECIES: YwdI family protein [Bacillus cereus group]MDH2880451.1 YwdI family protein [Bacillus cytotoxicus]MDH2887774.1 YwdI family protein [Bacillus cytotoxicus]QTR71108.1 YwdI family protein [Bacillus cytotoxicus]QTR79963.1 YwdI family protein [Bacillus cytotoxicus]HDR4571275.1 YwdI family protein [Bacillus cytotoxicus]